MYDNHPIPAPATPEVEPETDEQKQEKEKKQQELGPVLSRMHKILDDKIALARLSPGREWTDLTAGVAFDNRTNSADEYAARLAFECALRLAQTTDDGAERLALVAWNARRHAVVVQATDAPSEPFRRDARFQLYLEQPFGEFLVEGSGGSIRLRRLRCRRQIRPCRLSGLTAPRS